MKPNWTNFDQNPKPPEMALLPAPTGSAVHLCYTCNPTGGKYPRASEAETTDWCKRCEHRAAGKLAHVDEWTLLKWDRGLPEWYEPNVEARQEGLTANSNQHEK